MVVTVATQSFLYKKVLGTGSVVVVSLACYRHNVLQMVANWRLEYDRNETKVEFEFDFCLLAECVRTTDRPSPGMYL